MKDIELQSLLGDIHKEVAEELLARIRSGEATTGDISAAIKFLKDNNINVFAEESKPVMNLVKDLPYPEDKGA